MQDGLKPKLLCEICEQRFAAWERLFAETIFIPLHGGTQNDFEYGPWLLKFAVSVSWRVLTLFKLIGGLEGFPPEIVRAADTALIWWREVLLDQRPHPGPHEQHLLPLDMISETTIPNLPPNINRYLCRATDMYVAHTTESAIVYAKMGRVALFSFIKMPKPRTWQGTKIHVNYGRISPTRCYLPGNILDFLIGQAQKMANLCQEMSPRQREVINGALLRNPDRVANSDFFRAMEQDVLMFGQAAFARFADAEEHSQAGENQA
jgi:hypothetical protein